MVFPPGATAKADLQPQLSKKRTGTPRNTSRKKSKHHVEIAADDDSGGMRKGGDGLVFPPGAIDDEEKDNVFVLMGPHMQ